MCERSLQALSDAIALRKQHEETFGIPALSRAEDKARDELKACLCEVLAHVPAHPGEGVAKAKWLRNHLRETKGHMVVSSWDALVASIGGVRLPSFAEGL